VLNDNNIYDLGILFIFYSIVQDYNKKKENHLAIDIILKSYILIKYLS